MDNTVVNEVPSEQEQIPLKKHHFPKKLIFTALLVVIIAVLLGTQYRLFNSSKKPTQSEQTSKVLLKLSPNPSPNAKEVLIISKKGDKTIYTNEKYNYQFALPSEWYEWGSSRDFGLSFHSFTNDKVPSQITPEISITVYNTESDLSQYFDKANLSTAEYFKKIQETPPGEYLEKSVYNTTQKLTNETINGLPAVVLESQINVGEPIHRKFVYLYKEPYLYKVSISQIAANGKVEPFLNTFTGAYTSFKLNN